MVTASHNPERDNGIKIVEPDGGMLAIDWEGVYLQISLLSPSISLLLLWPTSMMMAASKRWESSSSWTTSTSLFPPELSSVVIPVPALPYAFRSRVHFLEIGWSCPRCLQGLEHWGRQLGRSDYSSSSPRCSHAQFRHQGMGRSPGILQDARWRFQNHLHWLWREVQTESMSCLLAMNCIGSSLRWLLQWCWCSGHWWNPGCFGWLASFHCISHQIASIL